MQFDNLQEPAEGLKEDDKLLLEFKASVMELFNKALADQELYDNSMQFDTEASARRDQTLALLIGVLLKIPDWWRVQGWTAITEPPIKNDSHRDVLKLIHAEVAHQVVEALRNTQPELFGSFDDNT